MNRLTLEEYALHVEAWNLAQADRQYWAHLNAYLSLAVKATKGKKQRPKYDRFEKFFDLEKEVKSRKQLMAGEARQSRLPSLSKYLKEGKGG